MQAKQHIPNRIPMTIAVRPVSIPRKMSCGERRCRNFTAVLQPRCLLSPSTVSRVEPVDSRSVPAEASQKHIMNRPHTVISVEVLSCQQTPQPTTSSVPISSYLCARSPTHPPRPTPPPLITPSPKSLKDQFAQITGRHTVFPD